MNCQAESRNRAASAVVTPQRTPARRGRNGRAWRGRLLGVGLLIAAGGLLAGCDIFFPPADSAGRDTPDDVPDANTTGFEDAPQRYRIDADLVSAGTWDFQIVRTDGEAIADLRYVWDFGVVGEETREGPIQRYAYAEGGDYTVTVSAFTRDDQFAFAEELVLAVPPIPNLAPFARAGEDRTVMSGDWVCLDATSSFDVNGDELEYAWWQLSGPPAILRPQPDPAVVCFTAPQVMASDRLQFGLRVSDAEDATEDIIAIEVINNGFELIADAGDAVSVAVGETVILNGSASRASDGSPLTYAWTQVAGPPVTLGAIDGPTLTFTAPVIDDAQELFVFRLTVTVGEVSAFSDVEVSVWQLLPAASEYAESFNDLSAGADPPDWLDTAPMNSLSGNDAVFEVLEVDGDTAFGTTLAATNVHSHYVGAGTEAWSGYTYTGRMRGSAGGSRVGVTFLSDYPNSDRYYRLRHLLGPDFPGSEFFHIAPHGTDITSGTWISNVAPQPGVWYWFEIQVDEEAAATRIRAKIWDEDAVKPADWQIDCVDSSASRLRSGTVGVWSMGAGEKYWDDLRVTNVRTFSGGGNCFFDTDFDGVTDCEDGCPDDPAKTEAGACGCGAADLDEDGNGVFDCNELPPLLLISRTLLNFGVSQTTMSFDVWNAGGETLSYSLIESASWLSLSSAGGESTGERDTITATIRRDGLGNGTHQTEIIVTPNVGAPLTILVTLLIQPPSSGLTPAARWDVVPRQRINAGETLKTGVVAFSKAGIAEVRFHISGQGYRGTSPKVAPQMTYNDRVDVWEYWVPISASEFSQDGPITVEAVVVGNDGGTRDKNTTPGNGLEALTLFVNPNGTLPRNTAYVALNGNDATAQVNNPSRPYKTIGKAMQGIEAFQGGRADGGVVRLRPGDYIADGGGIYNGATCRVVDEWITITHDPAAGGTQANTRIVGQREGDLTAFYLKVAELTLSAPNIINGGSSADAGRNSRSVWLKDCRITGGSGDFHFPVGSGWRGPHYYTECVISDQRRASGNGQNHRLMRNLTMLRTREDNFQSVPCGINIWVDGSDPGPGPNPEHADVIQGPPAIASGAAFMHNWIWYNLVAKDLHYQGIFVRSGGTSKNNAFVNCFLEMRAPIRLDMGTGRGSNFSGNYDHLLFWNCSFVGNGTAHKGTIGMYESTTVPPNQFLMKDVSIRGCVFEQFRTTVSAADKSWVYNPDVEIYDNHYVRVLSHSHGLAPDTAGNTTTTGDPRLMMTTSSADFGRPLSGSPLIGRVTPPLVPADATGRAHGTSAEIGALAR
jgi:hypothetical protein